MSFTPATGNTSDCLMYELFSRTEIWNSIYLVPLGDRRVTNISSLQSLCFPFHSLSHPSEPRRPTKADGGWTVQEVTKKLMYVDNLPIGNDTRWLTSSLTCSKTGTVVAAMDVFIQAFLAVRTVLTLYDLQQEGLFGVRARNACLLEAFSWIHLAGCHAWFAASESCWTLLVLMVLSCSWHTVCDALSCSFWMSATQHASALSASQHDRKAFWPPPNHKAC